MTNLFKAKHMPDLILFNQLIYNKLILSENAIGCRQPYGGFFQPPLTTK